MTYDAYLDSLTDDPPVCDRCGRRPAYTGEALCHVCLADVESLPDLPVDEDGDVLCGWRKVAG